MTDIWAEILDQLRLQLPKATFEKWLKESRLLGGGQPLNGALVVEVASPFAKDWIDNRLRGIVERAVKVVLGYSPDIEFRVMEAAVPQPEPTPPNFLPEDQGAFTDDISQFDLYESDWLKHSRYDSIFRRAYLTSLDRNGAVAFMTWDYLRSQYRHEDTPWTPKTQINLHDLVEVCAPGKRCGATPQRKSVQIMTGVNRRCPYFNGRCCGQRKEAQVVDGVCRYHVAGVLELLARERMIVWVKQGIVPYITYWVQVYRRMPLLTPHQVGSLSMELQEKHRMWLVGLKIYRAWAARTEQNFLVARQSRNGLELGGKL